MKTNNSPLRLLPAVCLLLCLFYCQTVYSATCTWNGGTGNWSDPAKWSCGAVPGSGDSVVINTGTVTLDQEATVFALRMGGGDITLNFNLATSGNLHLLSSNSEMNGTGNLTVNGNLYWNNGTIGGSGTFSLLGTLTSTNGTATLDTRSLSLTAGGTWTNQTFNLNNGAAMTVPATKTLTIANSTSENINSNTSASLIINGTLVKDTTGTLTILRTSVTNNGTITINKGTLAFSTSSSSTHSGGMVGVASGSILQLSAGAHAFYNNTQISGAGTFSITGSNASVNLNTGSDLTVSIISLVNGTLGVNSNQVFPSLTMNGGDLILADTVGLTVSGNMSLTSSSSTLTGNGNLAINGNLTLSNGGTIGGAGLFTVGGNVTLTSGTFNRTGNLSVTGNLIWNNGTIGGSGTFSLGGTLTCTGGTAILSNRQLTLNANAAWTNQNFVLQSGAALTISFGKTLTIDNSTAKDLSSPSSNTGAFNNSGTVIKNGAGIFTVKNAITCSNNGTLDVNAGSFEVSTTANSTQNNATLSLDAGTSATFGGGSTHNFTGTTISGAGTFKIGSSGTTIVNWNAGTTVSTPVHVNNGTLNIFANQTVPTFTTNLGDVLTMNLSANLTVTGNATLGLTSTGVTGPGNLVINGNLHWTDGKIGDAVNDASFTVGGTLTCDGEDNTLDNRDLMLTSGGYIYTSPFLLNNGANLIVPSGDTLTIHATSSYSYASSTGDGTITNYGVIEKTGNGQILTDIILNNFGQFIISAGEIYFWNSGYSTHTNATVSIASGCELTFASVSGTNNFTNTTLNGPGEFIVSSGNTINFNGGTTANNFNIRGGNIKVNTNLTFKKFIKTSGTVGSTTGGTLTVTDTMDWGGGDIAPAVPLTINANGVFLISNGGNDLTNATINLNGTATWVEGLVLKNSAVINISAGKTLTVATSASTTLSNGTGGGVLTNNGTLVKTGTFTFNVDVPYVAGAGSTLDIQQGAIDFDNTFSNAGTVKGTGTINTAGITGSPAYGTFSPGSSPGTLTVTGNYTNTTLDIELVNGSPVLFDKLVVSGTATLGGTLNVTETGTVGNGSWPILIAGTRSGTFATVSLPDCFSISYSGDTVFLQKTFVKIWDGTVNNWSSPGNWIPNGVPCPFDDVVINSGVCILNIQPEADSIAINGGELKKIGATTYSINIPLFIGPGGTLNIFEDTLDINDKFINDGRVEGFGVIDIEDATIIGGYGTFAPGNSAGKLKVKGTYCNEILESEIGATNIVIEHDLLEVTQTIEAIGTLNVLYLGGTVPPGTRTILSCPTAGCLTGTFATVNFPPECQGGCSLNYTSQSVQLVNTITLEFIGACTWLGGTGDWSTPANWSCNSIPGSNDTVLINSGQVMMTGPVTVDKLMATGGSIGGSGSLTVNGLLQKNGTGIFTLDVPFQLPPTGIVNTASGILDVNSQFSYGGTVGGNGTIDLTGATVQALPGGNFSPGASPGTLTVLGNYTNQILNMEITQSGGIISKDSLEVSGNVSLGGSTLNITFPGTLPTGDFELLHFGSNAGSTQFGSVNFPAFCGNCTLVYSSNKITLSNTQVCVPNLTIENVAIQGGIYRSLGGLVSNLANVLIGSPVIFKSDTGVTLGQDFSVPVGAVFEVVIEVCPQNANSVLPENSTLPEAAGKEAGGLRPKE